MQSEWHFLKRIRSLFSKGFSRKGIFHKKPFKINLLSLFNPPPGSAVPVQSLFERTVFRSGSEESEYDPQTYTMYLSRLSSDRGFDKIELHEMLHWIQHICYTFGGFQSALIHMRDEVGKHILGKYAGMKERCQKHKILFSLPEGEAFFNFYFDHEQMEQDIHLHQIAWRDALICEYLFLHMSEFYDEGKYASTMASAHEILRPELLIPRTLLRMNNWAIGTLGYRSTEPQGPLEVTDFASHPKLINFGQAIHARIKLDTDDIIEGMSVAFEIYHLQTRKRRKEARKRMKEIRHRSYQRAIKVFLEIMGLSLRHDNIARMAMMFIAIAEMSLNPPLPPFGIINKLELDWKKIYPPLRFIELCHIAKHVVSENKDIFKLEPVLQSQIWLYSLIPQVEELYLQQGGVFSYLIREFDGYLPNEKSVPFLALIAEENPTMQSILKEKGVNTNSMSEKFPDIIEQCTGLELYAMLRHAHILFMNFFGVEYPCFIPFVPLLSPELREKVVFAKGLYSPPIIVLKVKEGNDAPKESDDATVDTILCGWSEKFAKYLMDYNLFHHPLHSIMLRQEPSLYLANSSLIDEETRKSDWEYLQKTFSYIF